MILFSILLLLSLGLSEGANTLNDKRLDGTTKHSNPHGK